MKKFISIFTALILLLLPSAVSAHAEDFSSNVSGFSNVEFANGYHGFCIDASLKGAESGDVFTPADSTSVADNNNDGSDVSQLLKILLTQCFEDIFVSDGNGGYVVDSLKASSSVQGAIWNITDNRYTYGEGKAFVEKVMAYDGPEIPDEGYTLTLSTGETVVFSFKVVEPPRDDQQSFFCYKVVVTDDEPHEHDYSDNWSSDDENHWHECDCGDKADLDEHTATKADCINPSICTVCNKALAGVDSENHTGNTVIKNAKPATEFEDGYTGDTYCDDCDTLIEKGEAIPATHEHDYSDNWSSDDENHWHECDCGDKADLDEHTATKADCINPSICTVCNKELAGVDSENHTGNTVIKNAKPATEFEDGYTGDTYCDDCDTLIEKGEAIPATHEHDYSDDWSSDDENHWHECDCGDKADLDEHTATKADCINPSICTVCNKELAGVDSENHTGNTVIKNAKPATEFEDGYTGDTYCDDCDTLIEKGEAIPATHEHDYSDNWSSDDENHWHECDCGDKADLDEHTATKADCINPSICTVCNKELAGVDSENHTGNTVIKNAKPATEFEDGYTGDTYCDDCDTLIEKGEAIPATHEHDYSDNWSSDDENHWHECDCGDKADTAVHSFKDGVCTVCGEESATENETPSIDLDSILGALPEIDFDGILDGIIGIIGNLGSGNGSNNNGSGNANGNSGNNVDTDIPDTGSDAGIAFAYAITAMSLISLAFIRRKKLSRSK